jgi:hypothetical protein
MARKTPRRAFRRYILNFPSPGFAATAGHYRQKRVLFDLKGLLEGLAGSGEEVKISRAHLEVATSGSEGHATQLAVLVADAAIADVAGGGTTNGEVLDDGLDLMTAGDYEHMPLGDPVKALYHADSANSTLSNTRYSRDITTQIQKASSMLIRSALMDANPYVAIVADVISDGTGKTVQISAILTLDYQLVAKPLRMLG